MKFGRAVETVALAVAVGTSATGCIPASSSEHPGPAATSEHPVQAPHATYCENWAEATPYERAKLGRELATVAERFAFSVNGAPNQHPITPGLSVVAGCGKIVLASEGIGYWMYPSQVGKVTNSLTNEQVPQAEVSDQTEYDLASVTKLVTTVGILMMQQDGLLNINDPVGKYVTEYSAGDKARVTFKMLLEHESGLVDPRYAQIINGSKNPYQVWHNLLEVPLTNAPGTPYKSEANYSNVGFNVAYIAATNAAKVSPATYLLTHLFGPMGMQNSNYAPDVHNCPPTSPDNNQKETLDCVPQDDLARSLSMRAGNASLFMSAADLGKFLSMLSTNGTYNGHRYLTPQSMSLLKTPTNPTGTYGLGDRMNGQGLFGTGFSAQAYGHTGWNGGAGIVDPKTGLFLGELMNGTDEALAPSAQSYSMIAQMGEVLLRDTKALR